MRAAASAFKDKLEAGGASEEFQADPEHLLDLFHGPGHREDDDAVLRLDAQRAVGPDDLAVALDGADAHAGRQFQFPQLRADERRCLQRLRLDDLGGAAMH